MRAIQVQDFGGPDVMEVVELPDPVPSDGEVLVEVARCGINFGDTHATRNDYLAEQQLPLIPGGEIAGRTADGRRVAAFLPSGGYAERVAVPGSWLVDIPESVNDEQAAGLLVQGLTAHALVGRCGKVQPGETVVVQAAAGGTGSLAVQLAKRAGARVIALASSDEKREFAMRVGADATVDSRAENLKEAILEANDGRQVDVVFEMTGGATFEACLRTLAPFGRMVLFGIASREQNQIRSGHLLQNSRAVIGFWLVHLVSQRAEVATMIRDLLEAVAAGQLEVIVGEVYPLSEARRAHEDLAGRRTTGKLLLDPSR